MDVTEPKAAREGDKVVVKVKAKGGFPRWSMSPNDAMELIQQLQRALATKLTNDN